MNETTLFNDSWEFAKSGLELKDSERPPKQLSFVSVDLPHDWLIYDTLNLYENSVGWYRKRFFAKKGEKQFLLRFDGVYMDSTLYINGIKVGEWKYGYSTFEHNITDALVDGDNEIIVKVVHQSPNSRWYSGAGIYRNVWLKTRGPNYIESDGVYIAVRKENDERWRVEVDTELHVCDDVLLTHTLLDRGKAVGTVSERIKADQGPHCTTSQTLYVERPRLWSPKEPNLYQLVTTLRYPLSGEQGHEATGGSAGDLIETVTYNVGFRTVQLDPERGFILNGRKLKLKGVCEHHDLGALGAAFNKIALKRRFEILREMGVNAIRTAHNMPAPELMDLADEMGFFVVSEAFDMWERPKTRYDYARFFKQWAARDVRSWVRRDRNHPSLIMWSIGNEIYDTHADERGQEITLMLMEEVLKHDPKQNGKVTLASNYMPWENAQKCADIVKVVGYNYAEKYYHSHHEKYPDWVIYGSETGAVVQSRGVYHFPFEQSLLAEDDEQCSALGNSSTSWGAKSAEACIIADRDTPFSLGQFLWTGFDYIGEPTPYHTKNSYFGQIDTATFPKDSYYIYKAAWTDYKEKPMVHLFPFWDFNPGQLVDVRVCSNAPRVELQFNGETIGTFDIDHRHGSGLVGHWKIPYAEGELKAIAYDETGNVIATAVRRSFKDARRIRLHADKTVLTADGTDLAFVEISMEDEEGNLVENANNRVRVDVSGAGRLIGLDNGDSTDYDPYKGISRRLFNGKLMAIIAAKLEPGPIRVEVSAKGMKTETMRLEAVPAADKSALTGVSAQMENRELPVVMGHVDEIPLRKIELVIEKGAARLDPACPQTTVRAILYPADTSYRELEWSVTNDAGIPVHFAKVETIGAERVKVTAQSDGKFRLRCMSKNGTNKIKMISQLEFEATGFGKMYKDPYQFISAGLYDYSKGEVTNGNEKGVATARDGETQVGFRDLDFGPYGSDTITIPIFALNDDAYRLQIWEGMPDEEGSELVADVIYQKPSIWNVYQPETYKLSKRLQGVTSICFVLWNKVHIKGFSFKKLNRAFAQNPANECDRIYGDTYTLLDDAVEGIGNNVSLEFEEMDFTDKGASRIVICGRSPIDKNTIHIRFSGDDGESTQIVEFTRSDDYEKRTFPLQRVIGVKNVTFIFLPGSRFDFRWFRFE